MNDGCMARPGMSPLAPGARIDVIGNANNYPLLVVRALRGLGYDAHLHLTMTGRLNAPENRYLECAGGYPAWIHDWRALGDRLWDNPGMLAAVKEEARAANAFIYNYDAVFLGANETRPYFCLLTGTDLLQFANPAEVLKDLRMGEYDHAHRPNRRYFQGWLDFCLRQRAAVRQADGYSFFPRGLLEGGDRILESLGASPERQLSFLLSETDKLPYLPPRKCEKLTFLLSARLTWDKTAGKKWTSQDFKGSDMVLRGFAKFISSGGKAALRLFRKGEHVAQTERLAAELGIAEYLEWQDELSQHEFLEAMKNADVVIDSIGDAHIGMAAADAMSLGRPVIASAPDSRLWGWPEEIPICNARSGEEVAAWLARLAADFDFHAEVSQKARRFAEMNFSSRNAALRIISSLERPAPKPEGDIYRALSHFARFDREDDMEKARGEMAQEDCGEQNQGECSGPDSGRGRHMAALKRLAARLLRR